MHVAVGVVSLGRGEGFGCPILDDYLARPPRLGAEQRAELAGDQLRQGRASRRAQGGWPGEEAEQRRLGRAREARAMELPERPSLAEHAARQARLAPERPIVERQRLG